MSLQRLIQSCGSKVFFDQFYEFFVRVTSIFLKATELIFLNFPLQWNTLFEAAILAYKKGQNF